MAGTPLLLDAGWTVAEQVASAVRERRADALRAILAIGALAHADSPAGGDVELLVVTDRAGAGPPPTSRRVAGLVVHLTVLTAQQQLGYARRLTPSWPLDADRHLTARVLHDPGAWHDQVRDAHLGRLAEAADGEFTGLARDAWCRAWSGYARALRLAERHDGDGALLALGEARLGAALVDGLLNRTYFRDPADALHRTGLGQAGLDFLAGHLLGQADELGTRGLPVDGTATDLVG